MAGSILRAAYHMLRDGVAYRDLGPDHFVRHNKARTAARLANRIKELGYDVQIQVAA